MSIAGDVLDDVLRARDVRIDFLPTFDLSCGDVVGFRALAHGPLGSPLEHARDLFGEARRHGRVAELDWVCRAAAFRAFLDADLPPSMSLFITVEPESFGVPCPPGLLDVIARAESILRVFLSVHERDLAVDPAGLIASVDRAVTMGWGVVLDGVGASRAPLALLPVVGADLIRLDLRLLATVSPQDAALITLSVLEQVELTGAGLIVDGIADEADLRQARALGAIYGQGPHLGLPAPLGPRYPFPRGVVPLRGRSLAEAPASSPFRLAEHLPTRRVERAQLELLTLMVHKAALTPGAAPVILAGISSEPPPDAEIEAAYPRPETEPLLLVLFGTELGRTEPLPGLREIRIRRDDPLARERFLVVLSEKGAFAVLAREPLVPGDPFEVVLTQDPDLVHRMARELIRRLPHADGSNEALVVEPGSGRSGASGELGPSEATGEADGPARSGWRGRLSRR